MHITLTDIVIKEVIIQKPFFLSGVNLGEFG